MTEDNVFNRITSAYYTLTVSEKKLANFIVANGPTAQGLSISEMAQACSVGEATVSRFCRRLGYHGYGSFKLAIAGASANYASTSPLTGEIQPDDTIPDLCGRLASIDINAITETQTLIRPEDVHTAADALCAAGKVLCMGQGGSMLMAQETAHLFSTAFPGYFPVHDSHLQAIAVSQLSEQDLILYFSYSGSTKELIDLLNIARQRRIKSLLITRYPNSPGAKLASLVLQCGSIEGPLQLGSVAARIAQLYLVDVLFAEVCRRDLDACRRRRERVADALSEKHL